MLNTMMNNWWMLVLRGILAIFFGFFAIFTPGITLTVLVLMFGAYVLVDGGFNIYAAFNGERYERWWIGLLEGIVGVLTGVLTFIWPGITGIVLLYLIAFWAIVTGVLEILAMFQLRREIENEWLLGLGGILSVVFGALLIMSPISGALAVSWLIGFYAILFGVTMIVLGAKLRKDPGMTNAQYDNRQHANKGNFA